MRRTVLATIIPFGLFAAACGVSDDKDAVTANSSGEIVIDMDEFSFGTDLIEVKAGDTVTFVLVNEGLNEHEFMIGRNIIKTNEGYPDGFEHDFFEDVTPTVDPPNAGMNMGDMGDMDMDGMDMSGDDDADVPHDEDEAAGDDMDGMDMSGDDDADVPHDEDEAAGDDGAEAPHAGYMVERLPGESARLTVTIPEDAVGEWEIGCFRGRGAHWDAGMRSTLMVIA